MGSNSKTRGPLRSRTARCQRGRHREEPQRATPSKRKSEVRSSVSDRGPCRAGSPPGRVKLEVSLPQNGIVMPAANARARKPHGRDIEMCGPKGAG